MSQFENASLAALSASLHSLVSAAAQHVVAVTTRKSRSSGFVWKPGLIVTADEALAGDGEIKVILDDGGELAATLLGRDPSTDIALLKIDGSSPQALSMPVTNAQPGTLAMAVGSVDGEPVSALGSVARASGEWRSLRGGKIDARIELDARMRRSSEGGIAVSAEGGFLGMAVFGPRRRILVIPAATIDRVASHLQMHGRIVRGYLGLGLHPVETTGEGKPGAIVLNLDDRGPGKAAGIMQGDVLVSWNDQPIERLRQLVRGLGPETVGNTVDLGIIRAGELRHVSMTIGERPAE